MSPEVFRAPMRSRLDVVAEEAGVERALALGLCGMGGRLPTPPASREQALAATELVLGRSAAARLERFMAVAISSEVWTLVAGDYLCGVITGPWTYDRSDAAFDVDLVHVRSCTWSEPDHVPEAVRATFARGGRNFQRIRALSPG